MQKIQTQETLSALKSGEILMTRKADQIQFYALVNDRIRVQNANSRYTLSIEEWQTLFSDEEFWIYEPVQTSEISLEKDVNTTAGIISKFPIRLIPQKPLSKLSPRTCTICRKRDS